MSLKKDKNGIDEKTKYEFMQELGIMPNKAKQKTDISKKDNQEKVTKN